MALERLGETQDAVERIIAHSHEQFVDLAFAVPSAWMDALKAYNNALTQARSKLKDPSSVENLEHIQNDLKKLHPGVVDNFSLVYLSPKYSAQMKEVRQNIAPDKDQNISVHELEKFKKDQNDWSQMTLNQSYISQLEDYFT